MSQEASLLYANEQKSSDLQDVQETNQPKHVVEGPEEFLHSNSDIKPFRECIVRIDNGNISNVGYNRFSRQFCANWMYDLIHKVTNIVIEINTRTKKFQIIHTIIPDFYSYELRIKTKGYPKRSNDFYAKGVQLPRKTYSDPISIDQLYSSVKYSDKLVLYFIGIYKLDDADYQLIEESNIESVSSDAGTLTFVKGCIKDRINPTLKYIRLLKAINIFKFK